MQTVTDRLPPVQAANQATTSQAVNASLQALVLQEPMRTLLPLNAQVNILICISTNDILQAAQVPVRIVTDIHHAQVVNQATTSPVVNAFLRVLVRQELMQTLLLSHAQVGIFPNTN